MYVKEFNMKKRIFQYSEIFFNYLIIHTYLGRYKYLRSSIKYGHDCHVMLQTNNWYPLEIIRYRENIGDMWAWPRESGCYLRRAVEPDSDSVRPSSPLTARSERRMSSGSRRTHDERRRSPRRDAGAPLPPSAASATQHTHAGSTSLCAQKRQHRRYVYL